MLTTPNNSLESVRFMALAEMYGSIDIGEDTLLIIYLLFALTAMRRG
jgi:hypothetical protein